MTEQLLKIPSDAPREELEVTFDRQRLTDQSPRSSLWPDPVGYRHGDVVEEDLVQPVPVDRGNGSDGDPRSSQVEDQQGETAAPISQCTGATQQPAGTAELWASEVQRFSPRTT